jgi:hypothetical protein
MVLLWCCDSRLKASPGVNLTQVNDRLEFIKQRGEEFKRISSGGA